MRTTRITIALLLLVLLASTTARSQQHNERAGAWVGVGAGYGANWVRCDLCAGDRRAGLSAFVKAGGTLRPNLLLGGEASVWLRDNYYGISQQFGSIAAALYWYPGNRAAFIKGGAGYSFTHYHCDICGNPVSQGFGLILGAGYDVRVAHNVSVTPLLNARTGWTEQTSGYGILGGGLGHTILDMGVGLTLH